MQALEKTSSGQGAAAKSNGPAMTTGTGDKAGTQQAWNGYVQGLQAGTAGQGGPVGDGGLRHMFTAEVPIPGTGEVMYVGKWYYQNVTQSQVDAYEAHARKTDGWFEITKTQYEIQHGAMGKNGKVIRKPKPEAWTYHVRGPGGEVVKRDKMNFGEGIQTDDNGTFWPPDRTSATVEVEMSPPPVVACTATLRALDANGGIRVVATVPIAAGQKSFQTAYVLAKDEALQFEFNLPGQGPLTHVYALVKTTKGGQKQQARDDMVLYGTEMPSEANVKALLRQRRKGP